MKRLYASFTLMSLVLSGCASDGGFSPALRIQTARIVDVQSYSSEGSWGTGAVIGGGVGVLTGIGHSTESKVIRGAGGALIGAAINKAFTTGNPQARLVVQTSSGETLEVANNHNDLVPGDCVNLETRSDGDVQITRTSSTQCNF
jgi:outer membrane lipoprotein SlyB